MGGVRHSIMGTTNGARTSDPEVRRTIHFYRARVELQLDHSNHAYDPQLVYESIEGLPVGTDGWYMSTGSADEVLCVWASPGGEHQRLQIGIKRTSALPDIEHRGRRRPLEIRPEEGLIECSHAVLFADGIVGVEHNFYGPRLARLSQYLLNKCPHLPRVRFDPLISKDVVAKLARFDALRLVTLRVYAPAAARMLAGEGALATMFEALHQETAAPIVEITLRPAPRTNANLSEQTLAFLKRLVRKQGLRDAVIDLKVKGVQHDSGRTSPLVDILEDRFIKDARVLRSGPNQRSVDSEEMCQQIEDTYRELLPELRMAVGVGE